MSTTFQYKGVVTVILASAFLFSFSQFLLITAYPTIMDEFNVNATQVQWLTTAFLLTTIILIPMTGYLSNIFRAKTLVIFSLLCLFIGTLIGGLALNFGTLIIARVVQAVGAGIVLPLVQTILLTVFPYERRGFAMGLLGAVVNVAPASAPSISGIVIDLFTWRSLHWILLPLIACTLIVAIVQMKNVLPMKPAKLDLFSIVLSAIGFGLFIFGLSMISVYGFTNTLVIIPIAIGVVSLFCFIKRQLTHSTPVLNLALFKHSTFRLAMILVFINMMLLLSAETILPMFAQDVLGTSAFLSGFVLVPGTILLSIITIISGNLYDRYGGKTIALIGFSCTAASLLLLNTVTMDSSPYWIMLHFCLFMAGFGLTLMPLVTVGMNALSQEDIAHGSAIVNTVRQFGMTFGIIFLSTIISATASTINAPYDVGAYWGTTFALIVMALLSLLALTLTFFLKERQYPR
ncbi:LOW QUALITY PROTEIN: multidrug resistance protein [Geomicrobium sp. JCM 19038]|nr:LOW QUALITY PROTEIN: multidrug resistance protein [Geomicrobium sp. JCM 19038]